MKKKKLYPILTILVLIIIFSMAIPFMGCKILYGTRSRSEIQEDLKR